MLEHHRNLEKELGKIAEILGGDTIDFGQIANSLKQFAKDLLEHLKFEDEIFYTELIKDMREKGQDTSKTEEFIAEMIKIEKSVLSFLDEYGDTQSIEKDSNKFKNDFSEIVDVLSLRIESEEAGVYDYWKLS